MGPCFPRRPQCLVEVEGSPARYLGCLQPQPLVLSSQTMTPRGAWGQGELLKAGCLLPFSPARHSLE